MCIATIITVYQYVCVCLSQVHWNGWFLLEWVRLYSSGKVTYYPKLHLSENPDFWCFYHTTKININ